MEATEPVWPWLLATILFVLLLGSGRTLRGRWLGRPPFGAGLVLSVALGVTFFSLAFVGLGQLGAIRSPWPQAMLGIAALLALPGLFWTVQDFRNPAAGLERGFRLGWFTGAAWLLLISALLVSLVWITSAFGWEERGFLFERIGIDHELGRIAFDPDLPRDAFLGNEPLGLWLYGLGSAEATLALSWWLGVALLYGVCGLGWRLHSHGAGLLAATLLAIVLFASDRPLFLAPALPATVALLAVMILAVESRGRPNIGHSLVAGALGGFALISDLGAAAILVPLLLFGPFWCKWAGRLDFGTELGGASEALGGEGGEPIPEPEEPVELRNGEDDDPFRKWGDEDKAAWSKKWLPPLRHTAIGVAGLSVPLLPWLARSNHWTGDPFYAFRDPFRSELALRYEPDTSKTFDLQLDNRFTDRDLRYGWDALDTGPVWDSYLDMTEWGGGLLLLSGLGVAVGRRRRQTLFYAAPAAVAYGLGTILGDFETTQPSTLGLLSVTAGSSLYTMRGCTPPGRQIAFGTTFATGTLAIGLSGAYDSGYWDRLDTTSWQPIEQTRYHYYDRWNLSAHFNYKIEDEGLDLGIGQHFDLPRAATPHIEPPSLKGVPETDLPSDSQGEGSGHDLPHTRPATPDHRPIPQPRINFNF